MERRSVCVAAARSGSVLVSCAALTVTGTIRTSVTPIPVFGWWRRRRPGSHSELWGLWSLKLWRGVRGSPPAKPNPAVGGSRIVVFRIFQTLEVFFDFQSLDLARIRSSCYQLSALLWERGAGRKRRSVSGKARTRMGRMGGLIRSFSPSVFSFAALGLAQPASHVILWAL